MPEIITMRAITIHMRRRPDENVEAFRERQADANRHLSWKRWPPGWDRWADGSARLTPICPPESPSGWARRKSCWRFELDESPWADFCGLADACPLGSVVRAHERVKKPFQTSALTKSFHADLMSAATKGEAFDRESGLPVSMVRKATTTTSWFTFACDFMDMKWRDSSPRQRKSARCRCAPSWR